MSGVKKSHLLVFVTACLSLALSTYLLVTELESRTRYALAQDHFPAIDTAIGQKNFSLAWEKMRLLAQELAFNTMLPKGTLARLWDLWNLSPNVDELEQWLEVVAPKVNTESAGRIALMLLEIGRTRDALTHFEVNRFSQLFPELHEELIRVENPSMPVLASAFRNLPVAVAAMEFNRANAAGFLGDFEKVKERLQQTETLADTDDTILSDRVVLQKMRAAWDIGDNETIISVLDEKAWIPKEISDTSFIADLASLRGDKSEQVNLYMRLLSTGWLPSSAHRENMRLLYAHFPEIASGLFSFAIRQDDALSPFRAMLLEPPGSNQGDLSMRLIEAAMESGNVRLLRLALWYQTRMDSRNVIEGILNNKAIPRGDWWWFYSGVLYSMQGNETEALGTWARTRSGVMHIVSLLNKSRMLILDSLIREAELELANAEAAIEVESRGLDSFEAVPGLGNGSPANPYSALKADYLALRSFVERKKGDLSAAIGYLKELHKLHPFHPVFSRTGDLGLNAEAILGPDNEGLYNDTFEE